MKTKIASKQIVGNGTGCAVVRDLYENESGERESVALSEWFWVVKEDKGLTPDELIQKYPI
jgi:hypothetical protein